MPALSPQPSIFSLVGFWRGAAAARTEILRSGGGDPLRFHSAVAAYEEIADALTAGTPLAKIPAFRAWLDTARLRPANGRDALSIARP